MTPPDTTPVSPEPTADDIEGLLELKALAVNDPPKQPGEDR